VLAAESRVALHKSAEHRGGAVLVAESRVALHKSAGHCGGAGLAVESRVALHKSARYRRGGAFYMSSVGPFRTATNASASIRTSKMRLAVTASTF